MCTVSPQPVAPIRAGLLRRRWLSGLSCVLLALSLSLLWPASVSRADGPVEFTEVLFDDIRESSTSVAWGDVDGDGDLDLAVGSWQDGLGEVNRLYRNEGGVFTEVPGALGPIEDDTTSLAWGDMDGDGDLDLAVGNESDPNRVYRNDGAWAFSEVADALGPAGEFTTSVAWGDVDGDGDLDLGVANIGLNRLYRNDGGVFVEMVGALGLGADATMGMAWGDVDGDGDLDLAVGNSGQVNRLYRNDGGLFSEVAGALGPDVESTRCVTWGDVDGDGDLDLAVGNSEQVNRVYENDGGGVLTEIGGALGSATDDTTSMAWGDADGDGDLDLAVGNGTYYPGEVNRLYRNDGSGVFTEVPGAFGAETDWTASVAWGDMDGDGDLDLAAANTGQVNRVFRNDAGLFLQEVAGALGSTELWTRSVAWGDMDGDGDLDLAVGNSGPVNQVYRNDGGGVLVEVPGALGPATDFTGSVAWGDVDGDGDLDLAVGNWGWPGEANRLYRNDGGGAFTEMVGALGLTADETYSLAWGDMDGDGDLDLAVGNDGVNRLYRNSGAGVFAEVVGALGSAAEWTMSVAWADIDGDGDLDLALGNGRSLGQVNRIYRNDGEGTFSEVEGALGLEADNTTSIAWGDMDGDGDLDLAVANLRQWNRIYRNDGGCVFAEVVGALGPAADDTAAVAWGDVDGDGDLDLAVGNHGDPGEANRLYRNDGGGFFTDMEGALGPAAEATTSVAWGDMDGDGDLDLAVGNTGVDGWINRLYQNSLQGGTDRPDNAPWLAVGQPEGLSAASFYAISGYLTSPTIPVPVTLVDPEGDAVGGLAAYYSQDGGGRWRPAVATTETVTTHLTMGHALRFDGVDDYVAITDSLDINLGTHAQHTVMAWFRVGDPAIIGNKQVIYEQGGASNGLNLYVYDGRLYGGGWATGSGWAGTFISTTAPLAPGRWYHAAVVLSSTVTLVPDGLTLYLDGQLVGSGEGMPLPQHTGDVGVGAVNEGTRFHDGGYTGSGHWLGGGIDGVQIWNVALSQSEVQRYRFGRYPAGTEALVAYWPFDEGEGEVAYDASPGGGVNDATLGGGVPAQIPQWAGGFFTTTIYGWDTFASGFFGQSDNVVVRMVAYPRPPSGAVPGTYQYYNSAAGPYQQGYVSAESTPFRVRGTQVQVLSGTAPAENAVVYRLPQRQTIGAEPMSDNAGVPFRTDAHGYLQGRGQIGQGDSLYALLPITATRHYTLYHTSGTPTSATLMGHVVQEAGVQTLTVSPAHPLLLFNLEMTLEWDARNDGDFLEDLEGALEATSAVLYDVSDGQAAIGEVRLHQGRVNWMSSDVVMYAQNGIRPRASMGGVVDGLTDDVVSATLTITNAYVPGQIRMGPNWDPFGMDMAELTVDWQRALAHELAHYLFYLPDNYLGVEEGMPISTDCRGSFMTSTYDDAYSEFLTRSVWETVPDCLRTMAEHTTGRADWQTIRHFYPMVISPTVTNEGPAVLPLALTRAAWVAPEDTAETLAAQIYDLRRLDSGALLAVPGAQGYLFRTRGTAELEDDGVIGLGASVGGGDRIKVRGAEEGDRLCMYEPYDESAPSVWLGCIDPLDRLDRSIPMSEVSGWRPTIIVQSVTSVTLAVTVTLAESAGALNVQVYPAYGPPTPTVPISAPWAAMEGGPLTFTQLVTLAYPTLEGYVRVWEPGSDPQREALTQIYLSPPWGGNVEAFFGGGNVEAFFGGGNLRAWGANKRLLGAPAASGDGQVTIFNVEDIFADTGTVSLQRMNSLPGLPLWLKPVGQGYRFQSGELFPRVIAFDYLQREVPPGYEHTLRVYYSPDNGGSWWRLTTGLDTEANQATARMPQGEGVEGEGIYALMATIEMPPFVLGWNTFGYPVPGSRPVEEALASIDGAYSSVYTYDAVGDRWLLYDSGVLADHPDYAELVNDLTHLEFGRGYWLYATEAITLYLGVAEEGELPRSAPAGPAFPPATFYGPVTGSAEFTPEAGMAVAALIDGNLCGAGSVVSLDGQVAYKVHVAADSQDGCGVEGAWVSFVVEGQFMSGHVWDNSQAQFHPLGPVGSRVCLPLVLRGTAGQAADEPTERPGTPIGWWWPFVLLPGLVLTRRRGRGHGLDRAPA